MGRIKITPGFCALVCFLAWLRWQFCLRFLLCAAVHELGHLLVMKLCHVPVMEFRLTAGGAVITAAFSSYKKELLCACGGPVAGVLLGFGLLWCAPRTALISFLLSLINLLPAYPLDGGRILRCVLCLSCSEQTALTVLHRVMVCLYSILMLLACWGTVSLQMGLWPIFAALVLFWRAGNRD